MYIIYVLEQKPMKITYLIRCMRKTYDVKEQNNGIFFIDRLVYKQKFDYNKYAVRLKNANLETVYSTSDLISV